MQLVINSKGTYIKKRGECFVVSVEDKKHEISARKVQSIMITTAVLISTDAILLAHENNIDIVFLDHYGNPFSRIWHSRFGSSAFIRRRQLEYSENPKGIEYVKRWIGEKIGNQIQFLEKLARTRESKRTLIQSYCTLIANQQKKVEDLAGDTISALRGTIMAYEGRAGVIYFEALAEIIPERYKFSGRSRQPAEDPFNVFLNYGYGILYSRVERACVIAGLDPYIGFLHTDNYGKRSFVFDLTEIFRTHIDEVVMRLFSKRMVKQEMYRQIKNGIMLEKPGKQLLIQKYNEAMEKSVRYRGRNIKKRNIIEYECHRIANSFIDRKEKDADMVDL